MTSLYTLKESSIMTAVTTGLLFKHGTDQGTVYLVKDKLRGRNSSDSLKLKKGEICARML